MTATLLNYSSPVSPLVNQPTNSVVLSAAFGATNVSTTQAGVSFVANGANRGQSAGYAGPTSIQIQVTTSASFNTAVHAIVTIDGVLCSFTVVTAADYTRTGSQTPLQFSLTDANVITKNTAHTTNAVEVIATAAGLSIPVSVPNLFGAQLIKNGTNLASTTTTAVLGDKIAVSLTAPNLYNANIKLPLFIGNVFDTFYAVTNASNDIPTGFAFTNVVGAEFKTVVASNNVIVAGLDTTSIVNVTASAGATLFKNGVAVVGQTASVVNGDLIKVSTTTASDPNYDTTTYVNVSVGASFKTYWSVTTKSSTDLWIKNSLQGKALYDLGTGGLHTNSMSFPGGASYVKAATNAAYALPGAFTIDAWVRPTTSSGQIVGTANSGAAQWAFILSPTYGLCFYYGNYGANQTVKYVTPVTLPAVNVWTHIAVQRDASNVWTFYINGVAVPTLLFQQNIAWNNAQSFAANILYMGGGQGGAYSGLISSLRIVKDVALYSSNFALPTTPPVADSNTILLTYQEYTLLDSSPVAGALTINGSPVVSLASPFSPSAASLNTNNSIYCVNTSTYSTASSTSLYNPAVGSDASLSTFIYSMSYYEGMTYKLNLAGAVVGSTANPAGYTVYDECYAPKYVMSGNQVATRRFITMSNGSAGVLRDTSGVNADISFGALVPYGTDSDVTGSTVYVAMSNNTLAKVVLTGSTYALSKYISLGGATLGGLRQVVVDNQNKAWVLDVYNSRVVVINNADTIVASISLPNCDPWDISVDNGMNAWVACSFSNALARISYTYAVTYVQCSGVPSAVAVDKSSGNVWVGHYGSNFIDIFESNSLTKIRQLTMPHPVSAMSYDGVGGMWVQCLYSNLATFQGRLNPITTIDPVTFTPSVDVGVGGAAHSNTITISGLNKPVPISVPPNLNLSISVTGPASSVTGTTAVVNNGATVAINESPASTKYYYTNTLPALRAGSRTSVAWSTRTIGDAVPDPIYFDNVDNVPPGAYVSSALATITGISPGVSVSLTLDDPTWGIVLNGGAPVYGDPVSAVLNDTVQIVGVLSANIASLASKSVNIQVDIASIVNLLPVVTPTIFGNFTVYALYADGQAPGIQNAPGRYVDMYYEPGVKKPHLSLSETDQEFESSVHRNVPYFAEPYEATIGLANSPALADWFSAELGRAKGPVYADWFSAEVRKQTLVDYNVNHEYEYTTRVRVTLPQFTKYFEKGISYVPIEAGKIDSFTKTRDSTFYFADQDFDKPDLSYPREVGEREYEERTLLSFIELDREYEAGALLSFIEVDREYQVGQNLATVFADHLDAELSVLSDQHFGDYEYVPHNNMGEKLADWIPPIPRIRGNAMYITPTMNQGYTYKRVQKTFSMGFVRNTRHSEVLVTLPGPMLTYVIGDSGGGPVDTQQHLYTSAALAIAAGTKAGYVNVRAYGFNTVVYKNGVAVPTKAYMYVVPVGVTSRNCLIEMPINNNVIPVGWYVQGG